MSIIRITTLSIFFILLTTLSSQTARAAVLNTTEQFSCTNVTNIPQIECEALVALYNSTNGLNWTNSTGWLVHIDPCSWHGVDCNRGHITSLHLGNNGLVGRLPAQIGDLSSLGDLDLNDNQLTTLPNEIGNFTGPIVLSIARNQLITIPTQIENLDLVIFDFSGNQITTLPHLELFLTPVEPIPLPSPIPPGPLELPTMLHPFYNRLPYESYQLDGFLFNSMDTLSIFPLQTVPPTDITISAQSNTALTLRWKSILIDSDSITQEKIDSGGYYTLHGEYEVSYATNLNGPYTVHGTTEISRDEEYHLYLLDALAHETNYYIRLRTHTPAHSEQPNELWSVYSEVVTGTTQQSLTPTPTTTPTPTHTPIRTSIATSTPTHTATPTPTHTPIHTSIATSSPAHTATPIISSSNTWTILIYAIGDNDLHSALSDSSSNGMLSRLHRAGQAQGVQVGILYDGPRIGDTYRYTLTEGGLWNPLEQGEARMDEMETLRDFIIWGHNAFQSDYYTLALLDHANGVAGLGKDVSSDSTGRAFLTPPEIRSAILQATDTWESPLDILHIDGCSFGLFENTSIVDGLADYMIASPNTGWGIFAYDEYRQIAKRSTTPQEYARDVATHYADTINDNGYPYTISVFDMEYYDTLKEKIDALGTALNDYVMAAPATRRVELRDEIRSSIQKYDSGNTRLEEEDDFVDLFHLATKLSESMTGEIQTTAQGVLDIIPNFILHQQNGSGQFLDTNGDIVTVDLENAQGIGIFYPYSQQTGGRALKDYTENRLFPRLTQNWGWRQFLDSGLPPLVDPGTTLAEPVLIRPLTFGETFSRSSIYLPIITR